MAKFARQVNGAWRDPVEAANLAELDTRFHPTYVVNLKAANEWFQSVDDATYAALMPAPQTPQPNTPNNPYFGKKPLPRDKFWALIGQTLTGAQYKRLKTDANALWVIDIINSVEAVDPDDKEGDFLTLLAYLVTTDGEDAAKLMTTTERDTIMAAWPSA